MVVGDEDFVYAMLLREYFSLGANGVQAIVALWTDIEASRMNETIEDWKVTEEVVMNAAARLTKDIIASSMASTMCDITNGKEIHNKVAVAGNTTIEWAYPTITTTIFE
jgi:hypothetical protein